MLRSLITSAGVLLLGASAFAQSNGHSLLRPVTGTVKDAGVYHFGLGTWTRHADTTNGVTHDVVYANTCPTGYYDGTLTNEYVADDGRLPSANGPVFCDTARLSTNKGCACSYTICGFQIGYCSGINGPGAGGGPGPVSLNVGFQAAYTACALPNPLPGAPSSFTATGLPGAGAAPSVQGCWLVTFDLDAASLSFPMAADGASCTWLATGDLATNHLFGWTFQNLTTVTGVGNSYVGPLIAGAGGPFAPVPTCSMVDGTRWDTLSCTGQGGGALKWPNNLTEDGFGMDTQDRFRDDTTNVTGGPLSPPNPGCYYFGGNPVGSFHLRLFANTGCVSEPGVPECRPGIDFTTPTCPCNANQPTTAGAGCNGLSPGSIPTGGAKLSSSGTASLTGTTPGVNTLKLTVVGMPTAATESCFLIQGPTVGATPLTFGQGLRCVNGALKRLQLHSGSPNVVGGVSSWPAPGDFSPTIQARSAALGVTITAGQTFHYMIQYRQSLFIAPCVFPANFNASNAESVLWTL